MKLIFQYAKPFAAMILLSILLLFGQAIAELWLPNYMSTIVNVGLQQSGIDESVPEAMSDEAMRLVLRFVPAQQREAFQHTYSEVAPGDALPEAVDARLPRLRETGGWLLTADAADGTKLFQRAMLALRYYAEGELGGAEELNLKTLGLPAIYALDPGADTEAVLVARIDGDIRFGIGGRFL